MLKYFFLILGGIGFSLANSYGQDQTAIDSILLLLEEKTGEDRYYSFVELAIEYVDHDNGKALKFINEAEEAALTLGDSSMIVKTRRITLQVLLKLEMLEDAIELGKATLPIALRLKLARESSFIVNGLGIAYLLYGQYDKGLQAYFQTFELGKQLRDSSLMAMGLYNIGIAYYKLKDYENGLKYLKRSLSIKNDQNNVDHLLLMNLSLCYTHLNDLANAQKYLSQSFRACGPECSDWSMMHLNYTKGCIALVSMLEEEAEKAFLDSYRVAKTLKDHRIQFDNIYYLIEIYIKQKDIRKARAFISEAEKIIAAGSPFNLELIKIYSRFYDFFWTLKDYEKVAVYQQKYIHLRDSIYNEGMTTNLMKVESDFHESENNRKISEQQEILLLKENMISRQFILNIVTALLALITTAFLVVVFRNLNQKKELNYLLDRKIVERTIELQNSRNELLAALKERDLVISRTLEEITETVSTIKGLCSIANREIDDPRLMPYMHKINDASNQLYMSLKASISPTHAV